MAKDTQANLGFEKQLWDAACVLWGSIPAAEYRQIIVGLIFLRYISAAFEKRYAELVAEGDGFEDDPDAYMEETQKLTSAIMAKITANLKTQLNHPMKLRGITPEMMVDSIMDVLKDMEITQAQ